MQRLTVLPLVILLLLSVACAPQVTTDVPTPTLTPYPTNSPHPTFTPRPTRTPRPTPEPREATQEELEYGLEAIRILTDLDNSVTEAEEVFRWVDTLHGSSDPWCQDALALTADIKALAERVYVLDAPPSYELGHRWLTMAAEHYGAVPDLIITMCEDWDRADPMNAFHEIGLSNAALELASEEIMRVSEELLGIR